MAKVTINKQFEEETPTQRAVKDSNKIHEIFDESGRSLKVKTPTFEDTLVFERHFGSIHEKNKKYYESCFLTLYVKEIEGDIISRPTTEGEIQMIAKRLGSEGVKAIFNFIVDTMDLDLNEGERLEKEKSSIKK